MELKNEILGQLRPSSITAESIFSPSTGQKVELSHIFITNLSAANIEFSLFIDNDGSTYDETTAIAFDTPIQANTTEIVDISLPMQNSEGNFAVKTSSADDINFTLIGKR